MKRNILPTILLATLLLAACGDNSPTPTPATPTQPIVAATQTAVPTATDSGTLKPGWITGSITKTDGTPLTNANVVIRGTTLAGSATYLETQVDTGGRYAQQVPDGLYEIKAYSSTTYNNRTYGLWLDPADGIATPSQSSVEGLAKDFIWRISGPTPAARTKPADPHSYYGGIIDLGDNTRFELSYNNGNLVEPHAYPEGSTIRITLTPTGPRIDGSTGDPIVHDLNPIDLATAVLQDIPLGDYTATAALIDAGGSATDLLLASIIPTGNIGDPIVPAASAPVIFRPASMGDYGVEPLSLFILPPAE